MTISIDNFTLLSLVGKGRFSKVFLAKKKNSQRVYALKVVKKSKIKKPSQLANIIS